MSASPPVSRNGVCLGTRKDGEPCQSRILLDDGFCVYHSPTKAIDVSELARRGSQRAAEVRREQAKTVRDRLREQVEADFDKIYAAFDAGLESDDERTQLAAAVALLAEAYGRPPQAIIGDPNKPVSFILDSLLARARELPADERLSIEGGGE